MAPGLVDSPRPTPQMDSTTLSEARSSTKYLEARLAIKNTNAPDEAKDFTIPIIDLSPSFSASVADRKKVAQQIRHACTTSGFFYITSHRVPESARAGILKLAQRFIKDYPREKKEAIHLRYSTLGYGWEPGEYTSLAGDSETKEAFNWGYEAGLDTSGGDGEYRNLDGTMECGNRWPDEGVLPGFYEGVREYYSEVLELARHLFRLFALSLELDEQHFDAMTTHPGGIARLLYYPPSKPKPVLTSTLDPTEDKEQIGLGAHSDYECFTLLHSSSTPGLEILSPTGSWHRAAPVPGSFIVNVADFLMRWTNGIYKSTIHRVINRGAEERYSVPFFFSVNYDTLVETLPTCKGRDEKGDLVGDREDGYPAIRAGEYILERLNTTTKGGKGYYLNETVMGGDNE